MFKIEGFEGEILEKEPLTLHNTWRVGGIAEYMVFPKDEKDLEKILFYAEKNNKQWYILGNGSNVLLPDEGINGFIIKMTRGFKSKVVISYSSDYVIIYLGAGLISSEVLSFLIKMELEGLEFIAGIPGSIGGLLRMNAGAFGNEIGNIVEYINVFSISEGFQTISKEKLKFEYRKLRIPEDYVILGGAFRLIRSSSEIIKEKIENYQKMRREKQPIGQASCGSVFKNPKDIPAGKLIEEIGLKGFQVGGARISDIHANFIINTGNATAKDILTMIELIKQKVWIKKGIMLEEEVVQFNIKKTIKAKVL